MKAQAVMNDGEVVNFTQLGSALQYFFVSHYESLEEMDLIENLHNALALHSFFGDEIHIITNRDSPQHIEHFSVCHHNGTFFMDAWGMSTRKELLERMSIEGIPDPVMGSLLSYEDTFGETAIGIDHKVVTALIERLGLFLDGQLEVDEQQQLKFG